MANTLDRLKTALSDRYDIEREIGSGGMATVYLATDVKHERHVAIKVLRPELAEVLGPDRFLQEIKIAASLNHPHILPLLDSGSAEEQPSASQRDRTSGFLYYVMPYVEGESLGDRLSREGQLPIDDALDIARDVALGLSHAHSHGVVHRDIKPENILLSGGTAVVADFGIARAISEAGGERLTETGLAVGTPTYMSPEQAAGERTLDGRSDVYSLGCVLFEMLAGQAPFTGPTIESIVRQHIAADPRPVTQLRPSVPEAVSRTVERSLKKAPADRQSTAEAFAVEIKSTAATCFSGSAINAALPGYPYRNLVAIAGSTLLLLVVIYGLMMLFGLPNWVLAAAAAMAVAGSPVLVFTGHVERARSAAVPVEVEGVLGRFQKWISWRRYILSALSAVSALAFASTAFMASRAFGIGPAATLITQGVLQERDALILADFVDYTGDSTLALAVTEAIRTDLTQSPVVKIVAPGEIAAALRRMQLSSDATVLLPVAVEVAQREGFKAVVAGEVHSAGTGYLISARIVAAESGEDLTAVRVTARDSTEIVDAIDQVSAKLRERMGESLRTIRRSPALSQVTTSSLPALRLYTNAVAAEDAGDDDRALVLIEEAVAIDTAFAMAYRKLGMMLRNRRLSRTRTREVVAKAYEYRSRLTEREKYLATAAYEEYVTGDDDRAIQAYEAMLRLDSNDTWALNNLGLHAANQRNHAQAADYYSRAFEIDSTALHIINVAYSKINVGDLVGADSAIRVGYRLFPGDPELAEREAQVAYVRRDYDRAYAIIDSLQEATDSPFWKHLRSNLILGFGHGVVGQPQAFSRYFDAMTVFMERAGLRGLLLQMTAPAAGHDAMVRGDADGALEKLDDALERIPMESLGPAERPYGSIATAYAGAGRVNQAKAFLAEARRELDEGLLRQTAQDLYRADGYIALAEGRAADAVAAFRLSDAQLGCTICVLHGLGTAYRRAGEPDSAIAAFERFVNTPYAARVFWDAVWLASVYVNLGELYEQRNDRGKAVEYYNELLELWKDCEPELQPQVLDVRRRVARLVGEPQR